MSTSFYIGVSIFYALLVLLLIAPLIYFITQKTKRAQKRTMKAKDSRLKFLSDLINGIKTVKLNYFDYAFKQKVTAARDDEVTNFKKYQIFYGISNMIFNSLPVLLSVLSFYIYLSIDERNILTPGRAFTTLNYFNLLKSSLTIIPRALHLVVISVVAGKRIQKFLSSKEKDDYVSREFDERNAVEIGKNVNFSWEDSYDPRTSELTLKNLNVKIKKGDLCALVSKNVASGRSSFLSCLLGEMKMIPSNGKTKDQRQKVNISKELRIAFVGAKPWIEKKTIKENILFGTPYEQAKYNYVLDRCLIREELSKFTNADEQIMDQDFTIELKQKVCLARAYYSNATLVLLDDFLSTFNDYSAKLVFDQTIKGGLFNDKTCIMVLNRLEYLKYFDQILEFSNGEVRSECDFDKYKKKNNLETETHSDGLLLKHSMSTKLYNYENLDLPMEQNNEHDKDCFICSKKLVNDDEEVVHLGWSVYKLYFSTWKYSWIILLLITYFLSMVFQVSVGNWLSFW